MTQPELLWQPSPARVAASRLTSFAATQGFSPPDYAALWQWSVDHLEDFWAAVWDEFDVRPSQPYDRVLTTREMPGARWFPGARLNLADHVLRRTGSTPALLAVGEDGPATEVSWDELRGLVGALAEIGRAHV